MKTLNEVAKDIFEAAYAFHPDRWTTKFEDGQTSISYLWIARFHIYYGAAIMAGASAYQMDPETHRPNVTWRKGLLVTKAGVKRYVDNDVHGISQTVDLGERDAVGEVLQQTSLLANGPTTSSFDDPTMPSFDLIIRSSIGTVDINFAGRNDMPGYKALWETLTNTVNRYLELYDDSALFKEVGIPRY